MTKCLVCASQVAEADEASPGVSGVMVLWWLDDLTTPSRPLVVEYLLDMLRSVLIRDLQILLLLQKVLHLFVDINCLLVLAFLHIAGGSEDKPVGIVSPASPRAIISSPTFFPLHRRLVSPSGSWQALSTIAPACASLAASKSSGLERFGVVARRTGPWPRSLSAPTHSQPLAGLTSTLRLLPLGVSRSVWTPWLCSSVWFANNKFPKWKEPGPVSEALTIKHVLG